MSVCAYPCPCRHLGDPQKECRGAPAVVARYQKRISSRLLDRIDIHVEVPRVDYQKLSNDRLGEATGLIRRGAEQARELQRRRFSDGRESDSRLSNSRRASSDLLGVVCNADMRVGESLVRAAMGQEIRAVWGLRT